MNRTLSLLLAGALLAGLTGCAQHRLRPGAG